MASASETGFELERLIHEESIRLGTICRRECDIRKELNDTSLNGVDHWISKGHIHILIQDKWKETTTQPEIAQFLICARRIKNQLPKEASVSLLWVAKKEPTSYGKIILEEENVHMIINSLSIKSLSRQVYAYLGDVFDNCQIFENIMEKEEQEKLRLKEEQEKLRLKEEKEEEKLRLKKEKLRLKKEQEKLKLKEEKEKEAEKLKEEEKLRLKTGFKVVFLPCGKTVDSSLTKKQKQKILSSSYATSY